MGQQGALISFGAYNLKMIRFLIGLLLGLLLLGCDDGSPAGYLTVQDGVVFSATMAELPAALGAPAPAALWRPKAAPTFGPYELKFWREPCQGTGRLYQCPGGLDFVSPADSYQVSYRYHTRHAAATFLPVESYLYLFWNHSDTVAALGPGGSTLLIVRLDELDRPETVFKYTVQGGRVSLTQRQGDLLILGTTTGLELIDIADPGRPQFLSLFRAEDRGTGFLQDFVAQGTTLYATWLLGQNCGFQVGIECERFLLKIAIDDLENPRLRQKLPLAASAGPFQGAQLALLDDLLYVPLGRDETGLEQWSVYQADDMGQ